MTRFRVEIGEDFRPRRRRGALGGKFVETILPRFQSGRIDFLGAKCYKYGGLWKEQRRGKTYSESLMKSSNWETGDASKD